MQDAGCDENIVFGYVKFVTLIKFVHLWVSLPEIYVVWVFAKVPNKFMSHTPYSDQNSPYNGRNTKQLLQSGNNGGNMIIEGKTTESLISVHKVITIDNKSDIIRQYGQYNHID